MTRIFFSRKQEERNIYSPLPKKTISRYANNVDRIISYGYDRFFLFLFFTFFLFIGKDGSDVLMQLSLKPV